MTGDNPTRDEDGSSESNGGRWYLPEQWVAPNEGDELYIDGKAMRNPNGIWLASGPHDLAVRRWNGKRPTRRQRIGALVRRVLRRKAGL